MPEDHINRWVKDVFGVDPESYAKAAADKLKGAADAVGSGLKAAENTVVAGAQAVEQKVVTGAQTVETAVVSGAKTLETNIAAGAKSIEQHVVSGAKTVEHAVVSGAKKVEDDVVKGAKFVKDEVVKGATFVKDEVVKGATYVKDEVVKGAKAVGDAALAEEASKFEEAMKALDLEIKHVADAGLDPSHYAAQAKELRDEYAEDAKIGGEAARIWAIGKLVVRAHGAASDARADVARTLKSAVEGVGTAVTDMRDGAKKLIDNLAKDNKQKPELAKRLADLDTDIAAEARITDRAARTKKLKQINVAAESLFDDAAAAANDPAAVQAVYAKALKDRYGFDITNPANMKNTHLDEVYKMFDKVPDTDVVQDKLKTLNYEPLNDKGGKNTGASYGDAQINMGDYGDETWGYVNPATGKPDVDPKTGKPIEPNGFSISTLHELGHSIDDRFGIMAASQGKSGGGGWRSESLDSAAAAFVGQFKSGAGKALTIEEKQLYGAIHDALAGKGVNRPSGMSDADWTVLQPTLDICAKRRNDKWPWGNPHDIGGRTYHEAYAGQWWSYETAVRAKALTVRDYQWRAPGEFFAELYAYSYYNSVPPPGGVDGAIAAYMYGGKAASAGAPSAAH